MTLEWKCALKKKVFYGRKWAFAYGYAQETSFSHPSVIQLPHYLGQDWAGLHQICAANVQSSEHSLHPQVLQYEHKEKGVLPSTVLKSSSCLKRPVYAGVGKINGHSKQLGLSVSPLCLHSLVLVCRTGRHGVDIISVWIKEKKLVSGEPGAVLPSASFNTGSFSL